MYELAVKFKILCRREICFALRCVVHLREPNYALLRN